VLLLCVFEEEVVEGVVVEDAAVELLETVDAGVCVK